VHHVVALRLVIRERRQDAEAEHEAVEQHVHEHREADDEVPDDRQDFGEGHGADSADSSAADIGRAGVLPGSSRGGAATGPRRIMRSRYQVPKPNRIAYTTTKVTSEAGTLPAATLPLKPSTVRNRPWISHGWRPISAVYQPASTATKPAGASATHARRYQRVSNTRPRRHSTSPATARASIARPSPTMTRNA